MQDKGAQVQKQSTMQIVLDSVLHAVHYDMCRSHRILEWQGSDMHPSQAIAHCIHSATSQSHQQK